MEEKKLYKVSGAPFIRSKTDTQRIMLDVLIALLPAFCVAVWQFGANAIIRVLVSVILCVFFEWGYRKIMKKDSTIHDLSACVTGVLLAFCMPSGVPIWVLVIASFLSIVLVKQLYGGIGKNFLNPALAGRAFMAAGFPALMTAWAIPAALKEKVVDATTMATPLGALYGGTAAELPDYVNLMDLFVGRIPGSMGEISAVALLIGFVYLLARKVISWKIPVSFVGTVAVLTLVFGRDGYGHVQWMLFNLFSGGLMLGAIFMATDYCTSPVTPKGQLIFGVGCGFLTVLIRYFGGYPEGTTYAILIMNLLTWAIDKATPQRQFGVTAEEVKASRQHAKEEKKAAKEAKA